MSVSAALPVAEAAESPSVVMVFGQSDFAPVAEIGQEVDVVLQTLGAGEFGEQPVLSSDAVSFVGAFHVAPRKPGGVRQLFRFKAVKPGLVTITFTQVGTGRADSYKTIVDSFEVR